MIKFKAVMDNNIIREYTFDLLHAKGKALTKIVDPTYINHRELRKKVCAPWTIVPKHDNGCTVYLHVWCLRKEIYYLEINGLRKAEHEIRESIVTLNVQLGKGHHEIVLAFNDCDCVCVRSGKEYDEVSVNGLFIKNCTQVTFKDDDLQVKAVKKESRRTFKQQAVFKCYPDAPQSRKAVMEFKDTDMLVGKQQNTRILVDGDIFITNCGLDQLSVYSQRLQTADNSDLTNSSYYSRSSLASRVYIKRVQGVFHSPYAYSPPYLGDEDLNMHACRYAVSENCSIMAHEMVVDRRCELLERLLKLRKCGDVVLAQDVMMMIVQNLRTENNI